jgi:hypothetical protein
MNPMADPNEERELLLQRLETQRQRMDQLLSPDLPAALRLQPVRPGEFPRSQTMRLLMNEPMLLSGLSTLAARLVGPTVMSVLRAFGATFRIALTFTGGLRHRQLPAAAEPDQHLGEHSTPPEPRQTAAAAPDSSLDRESVR